MNKEKLKQLREIIWNLTSEDAQDGELDYEKGVKDILKFLDEENE